MTPEEAKDLLLLHSIGHPDKENPKKWEGFLGSLRPYIGLKEENFHEVKQAIDVLAETYRDQPVIDKEVAEALFVICFYSWFWALRPDGMLPSNGLIDAADSKRLERWLYEINVAIITKLVSTAEAVAEEPSE